MKKFIICLMAAVLALTFFGCGKEELPEENVSEPEVIISEPEEQKEPALEELCLMAEDALYFHCHTMDGLDFYEYGGFESPADITEEGLYNFFIAKNDEKNFLGWDKVGYHIPKKDMMDFYSDYFYDVSFLEEKLNDVYSVRFFSAGREENVIFSDDPQMVIDGDKITLESEDYEAVFTIADGKIFYESFKVTANKKWGLQSDLLVTDMEREESIEEKVRITSCAYPDWSYVKINDGRYISSREKPFTYYEELKFYRTEDLYGPFGALTVYKDTGATFDELLRISSVLVFEEDIIPVESISPSAEKACYVRLTYPSKNGEPDGYLRIYIIQFEGYVALSDIYIYYSDQQNQEGECEEFISGLEIYPVK